MLISETQTALSRPRSPEEYRETVETCLDAAQQMRRLTESLLQLARFDAGQELMHREPVDLADVARENVKRIQPLIQNHSPSLRTELSSAVVSADPERLGQVLINLLANAIQYNRPGGEIRVTSGLQDGFAVIQISDTGLGIAADDLVHVFERFYRVDKSRARLAGRSGLGLSISKAIVEAHGGTITAASEPGVETTFTLRFPVFQIEESEE